MLNYQRVPSTFLGKSINLGALALPLFPRRLARNLTVRGLHRSWLQTSQGSSRSEWWLERPHERRLGAMVGCWFKIWSLTASLHQGYTGLSQPVPTLRLMIRIVTGRELKDVEGSWGCYWLLVCWREAGVVGLRRCLGGLGGVVVRERYLHILFSQSLPLSLSLPASLLPLFASPSLLLSSVHSEFYPAMVRWRGWIAFWGSRGIANDPEFLSEVLKNASSCRLSRGPPATKSFCMPVCDTGFHGTESCEGLQSIAQELQACVWAFGMSVLYSFVGWFIVQKLQYSALASSTLARISPPMKRSGVNIVHPIASCMFRSISGLSRPKRTFLTPDN